MEDRSPKSLVSSHKETPDQRPNGRKLGENSGPLGTSQKPPARQVIEGLSTVLAPSTFLVALAYYFGWARTSVFVSYFGFDPSTFGFSPQDYLLRSIDPLLRVLALLGVLGMLLLGTKRYLNLSMIRRSHLRFLQWASHVATFIGFSVLLFILIELFHPLAITISPLLLPIGLGLGTALVAGALQIQARVTLTLKGASYQQGRPSSLSIAFIVLLIGLSIFWATGTYAGDVALSRAHEFEASLANRPHAVLHSRQRLDLRASGINEADLGPDYVGYRFRYEGLRLFMRSAGKYFFISSDRSSIGSVAIIIPDTDSVWVEFSNEAP